MLPTSPFPPSKRVKVRLSPTLLLPISLSLVLQMSMVSQWLDLPSDSRQALFVRIHTKYHTTIAWLLEKVCQTLVQNMNSGSVPALKSQGGHYLPAKRKSLTILNLRLSSSQKESSTSIFRGPVEEIKCFQNIIQKGHSISSHLKT